MASENHDLVLKFLKAKQLAKDDYYDVVIFGYLRGAIHNYKNQLNKWKECVILYIQRM